MTPSSKQFSFCLCADDYAMTPAVSRGILEALDAGALNATSVMTTSPWWRESAGALAPYAARASIGLHLNLTLGAPLGACPTLAPKGTFPAIGSYLRSRHLPIEEIDAEIGRQIDAFTMVMGRAPDHLDGHQHVHVLPPVRTLVLRHLAQRGFAGKVWLRDSADRVSRIVSRRTTLKKALGLAWIARGFGAEARAQGFTFNDGFAGYSDFRPGDDYGKLFSRYLASPGRRHLVMCHPGYVDDALRQLDPVTESREKELAFLLSPAFPALLARNEARLDHRMDT